MNIAVTGNRGYIGLVLCDILRKNGHFVLGIDSNIFSTSRIIDITNIANKELFKDFRDINETDLFNIDVIVHLAGLSNDPICNLNPELTYAINHKASTRLAVIAKNAGIKKFIFASSCSVYGETEQTPVDENFPTNPLTPYSISKLLVEEDLDTLSSEHFQTFALRFSTAYGWSSCMRFDLVVNNLVAAAHADNVLVVRDSPNLWRPFVHVDDIAGAILAIIGLEEMLEKHYTINIGSNNDNYLVSELIDIILDSSSVKLDVKYIPNGLDKRSYWVDSTKMLKLLAPFQPKWNIKSGIANLFTTYKHHNITNDIYMDTRFRRIDCVISLIKSGELDEELRHTKVS